MVVVMIVTVIMVVSVQRQCAARPRPEQSTVLWSRRNDCRCPLATYMAIETYHAVRRAHYNVQFMADHQNGASGGLPYSFDLLIE